MSESRKSKVKLGNQLIHRLICFALGCRLKCGTRLL